MINNINPKSYQQSLENILISNQSHDRKIDHFLRIVKINMDQLDDIVRYFISRVHGSNIKPYITTLIITLCRIFMDYNQKITYLTRAQLYSLLYFMIEKPYFQASPTTLQGCVINVLAREQNLLNRFTKLHVSIACKLIHYIDTNHPGKFFVLYLNLISSCKSIGHICIGLQKVSEIMHHHFSYHQWYEMALILLKVKESPLIYSVTSDQQVSILCQSIQLAMKILIRNPTFNLMCDMINIIIPETLQLATNKLYSSLKIVGYCCSMLCILTIAKDNLVQILNNNHISICDQICRWLLEHYINSTPHQQEVIIRNITEFIVQCPNLFELYSELIQQVVSHLLNLFKHCSNRYIHRLLLHSLDQIFKIYYLKAHASQMVDEIIKQIWKDKQDKDARQQYYMIKVLGNLANRYSGIIREDNRNHLWLYLIKDDGKQLDSTTKLALEKFLICKCNVNQVGMVQTILLSTNNESIEMKSIEILQEYCQLSDYYFEIIFPTLLSVLNHSSHLLAKLKVIDIFSSWIQLDFHHERLLNCLWSIIVDQMNATTNNASIKIKIIEQLMILNKLNQEQAQYLIAHYNFKSVRKKILQKLSGDTINVDKNTAIAFLLSYLQEEKDEGIFVDIVNSILIMIKSIDQREEYHRGLLSLIKNSSIPRQFRVILAQCSYWSEVEKWKNIIFDDFEDNLKLDALHHLFYYYCKVDQESERKELELLFLDRLTDRNISQQVRTRLQHITRLIDQIKVSFVLVSWSNCSLTQVLNKISIRHTNSTQSEDTNDNYWNNRDWHDLLSSITNALKQFNEKNEFQTHKDTLLRSTKVYIDHTQAKCISKSDHCTRKYGSYQITTLTGQLLIQFVLITTFYFFTVTIFNY